MTRYTMKSRPAGMNFPSYRAACSAKGMEPMDEDTWKALPVDEEPPEDAESDEDEDEDDEEEAAMERSEPVGDLQKALFAMEDVQDATEEAGVSRETFLTARLDAGTISKGERVELGQLWAGLSDESDNAPLRKSLTDYLDDEDVQVVDATPMLKSMFDGMDDRMERVEKSVGSDGRATRELLKAQGEVLKAVATELIGTQRINKALERRLGIVESSPAPRRSVTTDRKAASARPMAKSVTGGAGKADSPYGGLNKAQVLHGLQQLVKGAHDLGDSDTVSRFSSVTARFETSGQIGGGDLAAVRSVLD